MAGVVNAAGRCKISRFITYNRAVCSVMMRKKISLPYATGATSGRILDILPGPINSIDDLLPRNLVENLARNAA